jgi:hypothetical protein
MNSAKREVNQPCSFTARVKNLGSDFNLNFPLKSAGAGDAFNVMRRLGFGLANSDYAALGGK